MGLKHTFKESVSGNFKFEKDTNLQMQQAEQLLSWRKAYYTITSHAFRKTKNKEKKMLKAERKQHIICKGTGNFNVSRFLRTRDSVDHRCPGSPRADFNSFLAGWLPAHRLILFLEATGGFASFVVSVVPSCSAQSSSAAVHPGDGSSVILTPSHARPVCPSSDKPHSVLAASPHLSIHKV